MPEEDFDGLIAFPTCGTVAGDLTSLYGGHRTRMRLGSRIVREHTDGSAQLVITGIPPRVSIDEVAHHVEARIRVARHGGPRLYLEEDERRPVPKAVPGAVEARDDGDRDQPIRVVVELAGDADVEAADEGLRAVWPVTIHADLEFPGGLDAMVRDWANRCAGNRSGLDELTRLV